MAEEKVMAGEARHYGRRAMTGRLWDGVQLMKPSVSCLSAAATLLGYIACSRIFSSEACTMALSMFLLSGGASALNNIQDRRFDRLMARTKDRPLPARRVSVHAALLQAAAMIAAGLAGIGLASASKPALLTGLAAFTLYNGVYTPLKKKTHLAVIPGVLCGMLPPLAGWLAAGGGLLSPRIWYVMVLFCIWQVPHTWLVLLSCRQDVPESHMPTILDVFSPVQVERLIFVWTSVFAVLMLYGNFFGLQPAGLLAVPVVANALAMPLLFAFVLFAFQGIRRYSFLFHYLTVSMAGILAAAVIAAVLPGIG
jgi:heme o synthase